MLRRLPENGIPVSARRNRDEQTLYEILNDSLSKKGIQAVYHYSIAPEFHYSRFFPLFQSSFLPQLFDDFAQPGKGFRCRLLAFQDRLLAVVEIAGSDMASGGIISLWAQEAENRAKTSRRIHNGSFGAFVFIPAKKLTSFFASVILNQMRKRKDSEE